MSARVASNQKSATREHASPSDRASKGTTIRVLSLALKTLELLCKEAKGLGVRELARTFGVGKSTMHRILQTLEEHGIVRQDSETGRYLVTARLIKMAYLIQANLEIRQVARRFLSDLRRRCGETVFLGVLDSAEVVIVDRIDSEKPLRMYNDIGFREPAHSTALGKSLLAGLSDAELESRLRVLKLSVLTPKTTVSLEALKAELKHVRLSGFAIDDEETLPGVRCVAAPVRDASGRVVSAISVSGPSLRITQDAIPSLAQDVRSTAELISRELGFHEDEASLSLGGQTSLHLST